MVMAVSRSALIYFRDYYSDPFFFYEQRFLFVCLCENGDGYLVVMPSCSHSLMLPASHENDFD